MIKQNKLAASIATAIGASALVSGAAVAGSGLWPHVVFSPSVTTIVSVINEGVVDELHYILYYKDISVDDPNLELCEEVNVFRPTSPNDIQSIDLGNVYGSATQGVLFNDPSINNNWEGRGSYALAAATGLSSLRGYLIVDNSVADAEDVSGDALILEYANGAAWGYQAKTTGTIGPLDFSGEGIADGDSSQTSIKPFAEIATGFMVTPVSDNMWPDGGRDVTDISLEVDTFGILGVMFDRDENPVSGSTPQTVVCVGRVNATDLLSSGAEAFLPDGGWSNLSVDYAGGPGGTKPADGAVVYQLEYGEGTFNGEPIGTVTGTNATYNNAFELE